MTFIEISVIGSVPTLALRHFLRLAPRCKLAPSPKNSHFYCAYAQEESMKTAIRLLLGVSIGVVLSCACQAQMGMNMRPPDIAGVFNPSVGSGSSYELIKKDKGEKTVFDMSVVDKDPSGGYWVEYSVQEPKMHGPMYMKELMTRKADDVLVEH